MKLDFSLLIVDDNPSSLRQAVIALEEYLEIKGFKLTEILCEDFSDRNLRKLTKEQGKNFDLVIVDYNLGRDDLDGAKVAQKLRRDLPYTEMVFYSSDSTIDLLRELANSKVDGVFARERNALDDALKGIADTVIGKAIDLNHMRGIVMAEVADMDVIMTETLQYILKSADERALKIVERTTKKLVESAKQKAVELESKLQENELLYIIEDVNLFSSYDRYRAIMRAAKSLNKQHESAIDKLKSYNEDINIKRNMLAHAKGEIRNTGEVILRPAKNNSDLTVIDDEWMQSFRKELKDYRKVLDSVCNALRTEFFQFDRSRDPQEG